MANLKSNYTVLMKDLEIYWTFIHSIPVALRTQTYYRGFNHYSSMYTEHTQNIL